MTVLPPPIHSVWENANGKLFVADVTVNDEFDDVFFVSLVLYVDRYNLLASGEEVDARQWGELMGRDMLRMIGIEPV